MPAYRACAARWPGEGTGEGTGCDTMEALAEIWRLISFPLALIILI